MSAAPAQIPQQDVEAPLLGASPEAGRSHFQEYATQFYAWLSHVATCFLLGAVCAICLKIFGPPIAYAIAGLFIMVLVLAYYGYVNLNWGSFVGMFKNRLDLNNDGRVSFTDLKVIVAKTYQVVVSFGLSSIGGFGAGFWVALKIF